MDCDKTDTQCRLINRRSFVKLMGLMGLGCTGFIAACDNVASKDKGKVSLNSISIPPIDLAVPSKTETATFSMG